MAESVVLAVCDADGRTIAEATWDAPYVRAIESLWKSATDTPSRAAILRGLHPPLDAARGFDPARVSLVIDGVELG